MPRLRVSLVVMVAGVALAAAALSLAAPAAAGVPAIASGSYQLTPTSYSTRSADGDLFVHGTGTVTYAVTGPVTGTESETFDFVIHKDGSIEGHGTATCSCTLGGRSGTLYADYTMYGSVVSDDVVGRITFTGASGGLAGLHGGGTYEQRFSTGNGSYSYSYVLVP